MNDVSIVSKQALTVIFRHVKDYMYDHIYINLFSYSTIMSYMIASGGPTLGAG